MADNETTKDLEHAIDRLTSILESGERAARQAGHTAVGASTALVGGTILAGTVGAGVAGARQHGGGLRGFGRFATATAGRYAAGAGMGGAFFGGSTMFGKAMMALRVAGPALTAVAGAALLFKTLGGSGKGSHRRTAQLQEQQTALLQQLVAEFRVAGSAAGNFARADPYGRGRIFAARYAPSMAAAGAAANLQASRMELAATSAAGASPGMFPNLRARINREQIGPLSTWWQNTKQYISGRRQFAFGPAQARSAGSPFSRGRIDRGNGFEDIFALLQGGWRAPGAFGAGFAGIDRYQQENWMSGLLRDRQRDLWMLQQRGPGVVLQPSATVRAGTVGEHQFRVRQQLREANEANIQEYRSEVLRLLNQIANISRDGNVVEEIIRKRFLWKGANPNR